MIFPPLSNNSIFENILFDVVANRYHLFFRLMAVQQLNPFNCEPLKVEFQNNIHYERYLFIRFKIRTANQVTSTIKIDISATFSKSVETIYVPDVMSPQNLTNHIYSGLTRLGSPVGSRPFPKHYCHLEKINLFEIHQITLS